jgi:hypothetical protein
MTPQQKVLHLAARVGQLIQDIGNTATEKDANGAYVFSIGAGHELMVINAMLPVVERSLTKLAGKL